MKKLFVFIWFSHCDRQLKTKVVSITDDEAAAEHKIHGSEMLIVEINSSLDKSKIINSLE
jgi:hypothetical protein